MHLCAVTARADEALSVYNLMRLETDPHNLPDKYTYAALVRATVLSGRYEMTASVRAGAVGEGGVPGPGRPGRSDLGRPPRGEAARRRRHSLRPLNPHSRPTRNLQPPVIPPPAQFRSLRTCWRTRSRSTRASRAT
jgi:hypothetical protein